MIRLQLSKVTIRATSIRRIYLILIAGVGFRPKFSKIASGRVPRNKFRDTSEYESGKVDICVEKILALLSKKGSAIRNSCDNVELGASQMRNRESTFFLKCLRFGKSFIARKGPFRPLLTYDGTTFCVCRADIWRGLGRLTSDGDPRTSENRPKITDQCFGKFKKNRNGARIFYASCLIWTIICGRAEA